MVTVLLARHRALVNLELGPAVRARTSAPLYAVVARDLRSSPRSPRSRCAPGAGSRSLAYAQVALDVARRGRGRRGHRRFSDSVFVFLFSLGIVNGSILLFRRGALTAARARGRPPTSLVALRLDPARRGRLGDARSSCHAASFVAVAVLSSYLAEQLRSTGERLAAKEGALAEITALHESIVAVADERAPHRSTSPGASRT